ncbi:MAG: antibiotic biosynthesis monooxygenase [Hyphomicrobiales bacterium]|nr:antibiotic biosynthesis monooxygenase [Hyphomicrobiales bacterium]
MLIVLGSVIARSDTFDEIQRFAREHVDRSRLEPGCLSHAVLADLEDPMRLVFVERWTDWVTLGAHFQVPASIAFAQRLNQLSAAPPEMQVYEAALSAPPRVAASR